MGSAFPYLPPLLILTSFGYFAFSIVALCLELRRRAGYRSRNSSSTAARFLLAGMAPTTVAILMTLIFYIPYYIDHGVTSVLFGSQFTNFDRMGVWMPLCVVFLPLTAVSAVGSLIWLIVCLFKKSLRRQIPAAFFSILYSVLAFFAAFYPLAFATA